MTISRSQMNRQLYGLGSYFPSENGREKYGLGSSLKKFVRKIIPNEVSKIAVKAAPFVAPFNPALAAGMAGIGGFDQTGRIGSSLKSAAMNYGLGQAARYAGGAGFQGNPFTDGGAFRGGLEGFKGGFSSPFGNKTGFGKMLSGTEDVAAIEGVGADNIKVISGGDFGQSGEASTMFVDTGSEAFNTNAFSNAVNQGSQAAQAAQQVSQSATKSYMDLTRDLFSGNFTEMGNAAKNLGGKALKDIYTTPITNAAGEIVNTKLDKTTLLATLVMVPSYMDAKKLADDAGLDDKEFNENLYNSKVDARKTGYQANLKPENFGITTKANGGRIGYKDGTPKEGIASLKDKDESEAYMLQLLKRIGTEAFFGGEPNPTSRYKEFDKMSPEYQDRVETRREKNRRFFQKPENYSSYREEGVPRYDFYGVEKKAMGGRIGYKDGTLEDIVSQTDDNSAVIYRDPDTGESLTSQEFLRRADEDEFRKEAEGIKGLMMPEEKPKGFKNQYFYDKIIESKDSFEPQTFDRLKRTYEEKITRDKGGIPSITLDETMTEEDMPTEGMSLFFQPDGVTPIEQRAKGGRIGFSKGTDKPPAIPADEFQKLLEEFIKNQDKQEELRKKKAMGGRIGYSDGSPGYWEQAQELFDQVGGEEATGLTLIDFANKYLSLDRNNKAMGGSMGSEVPIRRNQGGISELDYRNTGGFVPIGVKEKADDVPAMLSKNEFVFTADAVRNAGGGNVNKGAQKMYNTMKSLENKVV